jgi:hypothetical protein
MSLLSASVPPRDLLQPRTVTTPMVATHWLSSQVDTYWLKSPQGLLNERPLERPLLEVDRCIAVLTARCRKSLLLEDIPFKALPYLL